MEKKSFKIDKVLITKKKKLFSIVSDDNFYETKNFFFKGKNIPIHLVRY